VKREFLLMLGLSCGLTFGLWTAVDFKNVQGIYFTKVTTEKRNLQRHLKALEDDLTFLKVHQKELDFLVGKGWLTPKNRLVAGEVLEKQHGSLNSVQYTFEPESIKNLDEDHTFKVTSIVMEIGALLDTDIYEFVDSLLEEFPGILRPHELTFEKGEHPNFVVGKLVFEWFALAPKVHEN
jgi:hypothetical protein